VRAGGVVEQLHREQRVLQRGGRVAEVPVHVRPDQVGAGLHHVRGVVDAPLVNLPDPPGGRTDLAQAHPHVGLAEAGPDGQFFLAQAVGPVLEVGRDLQGRRGVPHELILDRDQGSTKLLGCVQRSTHAARLLSFSLQPLAATIDTARSGVRKRGQRCRGAGEVINTPHSKASAP
jgi:hypothetical protein